VAEQSLQHSRRSLEAASKILASSLDEGGIVDDKGVRFLRSCVRFMTSGLDMDDSAATAFSIGTAADEQRFVLRILASEPDITKSEGRDNLLDGSDDVCGKIWVDLQKRMGT
jgi:hypothetical protein